MMKNCIGILSLLLVHYMVILFSSGCAQIGAPTGGPRDSAAPVLVKSVPTVNQLNFTGNKVVFTFDEYIELQDLQNNLLISPLQKNNPTISSNLKTITVKFKDSLLPNTTYSINFGDAIKDVNEGNPASNFTYTFSTGNQIDSLQISGKVILAETGKTDSTLIALLYREAPDSAVNKRKPDYIARIKGDGTFAFSYLPDASFSIYALKDGDGGKTYNAKTELFAFYNKRIQSSDSNAAIILYAYDEEKPVPTRSVTAAKKQTDKSIRYSSNLNGLRQDLLQPLEFTFPNALKKFDTSGIVFSDTNFIAIKDRSLTLDSTRKKLTLATQWIPESFYYLILPKEAFEDSSGLTLAKTDSIRFNTKSSAEYGSIVLRFTNTDPAQPLVIQFLEADKVKYAYPLQGNSWSNAMFPPGEYDLRILYDENNNGVWDPGSYTDKKQPERSISIPQKVSIRANWDNERDIELP